MTTYYVHNTPRLQLSDHLLKKLYSLFTQEMFSTNYLIKSKGIRTRCPKNKREGITTRCPENKQEDISTRCPENKQKMIRSPQHASPITSADMELSGQADQELSQAPLDHTYMDYYNIKCKTCGVLISVPPIASKQRCSKCNDINYFTPKIQQPSANINNDQYQSQSFRAFASKCMKDKGIKSPYPHSLNNIHSSSATTARRSNKRALLCGVTYNTSKYMLKGTVNDAINMKDLLITQFHYRPESIKVMTEYEKGEFIPTKQNIKNSLKWLVDGCRAGDSLVFYSSGHGLRQPDFKDDERDGFDETICPVDFLQEGMILDNDINTDIVKPLKKGVTLHAIVDACQSRTILGLVHLYDHHKCKWEDNSPPSGVDKGTSGGLAICISACNEDKMASETSAFSSGQKTMNGAMTFILCRALKQNPEITYGALLNRMSEAIQQVNADRLLQSGILRKMFRHKVIQEPMLSSSEKFDVNRKKFIL